MKVLDFKSKRNAIIRFVCMFAFIAVLVSCKKDEIKSSECEIVSFTVDGVEWNIYNKEITYAYPAETEEISMRPTITLSPGATVSPESGVARNFFTNEGITYTVTAEDGVTKKIYTVKATIKAVDSGVTGKCTWTITGSPGNYTITISGNGAMADYLWYEDDSDNSPWYTYKADITTVVIQQGVTHIGNSAFLNCKNMVGTLTIPNSVTSIGRFAFAYCKFTGTLTIPSSVKSIGVGAFGFCSYFTGTLTIPSSVTTIELQTFLGCFGLTGTLSIPSSVTSIGDEAFYGCLYLNSLIIPSSVGTIGEGAFGYCASLTSITNQRTTPQNINSNVFEYVDKTNCKLKVPAASVSAYKTATGWKDFTNIEAY
jgi:hypothetical protein